VRFPLFVEGNLNAPTTVIREAVQALRRVVIEGVAPEVDAGRFPVKRTVGEKVQVRADVYADGHDLLRAVLLHRREDEKAWTEQEMRLINNDRWGAQFAAQALGRYIYSVAGWVDEWGSWTVGLRKKADAGQDVSVDVLVGVGLLQAAAGRARGVDAKKLTDAAVKVKEVAARDKAAAVKLTEDSELAALVNRNRDRDADTRYEKELAVVVDPVKARFSTW